MLYRQQHMNAYSRLQMIGKTQRTDEEHKMLMYTQWPDQYYGAAIVGWGLVFTGWWWAQCHPIGMLQNRDRTFSQGLNMNELNERNRLMSMVFEEHREYTDQIRTEIGQRPPLFGPPQRATQVQWNDTGSLDNSVHRLSEKKK